MFTKTGQHYEGAISSTSPKGDTAGVTLKAVKEISKPGTPLKDSLFIASTNIEYWQFGPADAKLLNGDGESSNTNSLDLIISRLICCLSLLVLSLMLVLMLTIFRYSISNGY